MQTISRPKDNPLGNYRVMADQKIKLRKENGFALRRKVFLIISIEYFIKATIQEIYRNIHTYTHKQVYAYIYIYIYIYKNSIKQTHYIFTILYLKVINIYLNNMNTFSLIIYNRYTIN